MPVGKHHCNQTEQFLPAVESLGAKLNGQMQLMPTGNRFNTGNIIIESKSLTHLLCIEYIQYILYATNN